MGVISDYLEYHKKYAKKYGNDHTLVLMQVGSFYETYSTTTEGPDLENLSNILDIQLTRKKKSILEVTKKNPNMLGFPTGAFSKYKRRLIDSGWTIIIIDQITPPPNVKRKVIGVYSPGTCIDDLKVDSNNLVSLYFSNESDVVGIGMTTLDLSIGTSIVNEIYPKKGDEKLALDEASRWLSTYSPKEVIIGIYKQDEKYLKKIITYLELEKSICHIKQIPKEFYKLKYQNTFFSKIWSHNNNITPIERLNIEKMPNTIISLLNILHFVMDHNIHNISKLSIPDIYNANNKLILGNNASLQLNIIENNTLEYTHITGKKTYRCLIDVIDKTSTAIGKRALRDLILNPLVDVKEIQDRYNYVQELKDNTQLFKDIEYELQEIGDIARAHRKIGLCLLPPIDFVKLDTSYKAILQIFNKINNNNILKKINIKDMQTQLNKFTNEYSKIIDSEQALKYILTDMTGSFFKKKYNKEVDIIQLQIDEATLFLKNICTVLSRYVDEEKEFIKLSHNDREGYYLELTKKRAETLKKAIKNIKNIKITNTYSVKPSDLKYDEKKKDKTKITFDKLNEVSDELIEAKENISTVLSKLWKKTLQSWSNSYESLFEKLVEFVGLIDILKSSAKCANVYNYKKPEIIQDTKGWFSGSKMRHPIIERLCTDNEYIPHSIQLNSNNISGIMLFGLNSSGKSSIMKMIGLHIIMAQAGMFIPAEQFKFSPYYAIYARITGHDNLFKGLSSFELEMVELKAILKRANKKTLVIGDEICRGTEWISGVSIVASTIETLSEKKIPFIFATHLHMIMELERISKIENIKAYHLTVTFDSKNDRLIFDRILKEGTGPHVYGLTVAKYILDNKEFMEKSLQFKNEILNIDPTIKTSKYNSTVYIEKCEICGCSYKKLLDTHHINFQSECKNGFSLKNPHIQKNEKYNLVILCKICHTEVHKGKITITGWKKTSDGFILEYKRKVILKRCEYNEIINIKKNFKKYNNESYSNAKELLRNKNVFVPCWIIRRVWNEVKK